MALTEDLNIYRSMYKLLLALIDARNDFDKSFKYVVGERMVNTALDCVSLIHFANEDRRQFKKDSVLADVFLLVADVENQAGAWRRSATA